MSVFVVHLKEHARYSWARLTFYYIRSKFLQVIAARLNRSTERKTISIPCIRNGHYKSNDWRVHFFLFPIFHHPEKDRDGQTIESFSDSHAQRSDHTENASKVVQMICYCWLINNILCTRKCIWTVRIWCCFPLYPHLHSVCIESESTESDLCPSMHYFHSLHSMVCVHVLSSSLFLTMDHKTTKIGAGNRFKWCLPVHCKGIIRNIL